MKSLSDNARGSLLMAAGMAAFTVNDTFMKLLFSQMPLSQALFLRGLGTMVALLLIGRIWGGIRFNLPRRDWILIALRTIGEIAAAYFFLTALFHIPLANANAIMQTLPLAVTLAGAVFLREPVGWRRWTAIVIGFVGVLLIVRPGPDGFNVYALMTLAAVASVTLRDLVTRQMSPQVPSMAVSLCAAVGVTGYFGVASVFDDWIMPDAVGALQLLGATGAIVGGYLFSVMSMRVGDLGFVAPFRYTSLVWALVLGFFVFGDWPDPITMLGAGIVVATGLFTLYRALQVTKRPPLLTDPV